MESLRWVTAWELIAVPSAHSLFLMSFSSFRMRDDSCSGVGVLKDREGPPSAPDGGVGNLCLKSSSMLLCSLRFRPCTHNKKWWLHKTTITETWLTSSNVNLNSPMFFHLHSTTSFQFISVPPFWQQICLWSIKCMHDTAPLYNSLWEVLFLICS